MDYYPKVSVCVITYNHGEWLRECLQSIVDQVTDFNYEVIVGDDCSIDAISKKILSEFAAKYPEKIFPLFREKNMGGGGTINMLDVMRRASGIYIAHMDGDDRMLPGKLQKQADFLDKNQDCSVVAHDLSVFDAISGKSIASSFNKKPIPPKTSAEYLLVNHCFFGHSSKMYRKSAIITTESQVPLVDYYFHIEHAKSGKLGYISEILGEYRKSSVSNSSSFGTNKESIYAAYELAFKRALELGFAKELVNESRIIFKFNLSCDLLRTGDYAGFRRNIILSRKDWRVSSWKHRVLYLARLTPAFCSLLVKFYDKIWVRA
jgi:glycosyltransferase involved in cell wall biosynthesis